MNITQSIYKQKLLLTSVLIISIFALFGLYYISNIIRYTAIKNVSHANLNYNNQSEDINISSVKDFSELVQSDYKEINISFYAKVKSISGWNNIFQTAPLNSGIRMELSEPSTLGLVIKSKNKEAFRGFYLTRELQLDKWYFVDLKININKHLIVLLDNKTVIDEVDPNFDFDISEIAVGSGFSKTRPFDGEISKFEIRYSIFKKNDLLFLLLTVLKILLILSLILCTYLLAHHKVVELFKGMFLLAYHKVVESINSDATAIPFIPGSAYMKVYNILNRSIGSFLLVLAILVFYSILFPEWLYDQVSFVDAFAYLGHILNPAIQRNGFPNHPSGDVLPAILPGYLFHAVLPAILANFIYKILLAATTTFLLFKIIQKFFGLELAVLSIFITLTNSFFLASVGSYYPLSMVIFYLAAVLFFIVKTCENKTKWRILYLGLIGFFISCMMSSALLSIVFTPGFLILFYALKKWEKGRSFDFEDLIIPLGFIAGIVFFCVIHYYYTNTFIYFRSTINKALSFLDQDRTRGSVTAWVFNARWLSLSALILFYTLLKSILARERLFQKIIDAMKFNIRPENVFLLMCNLSLVLLSYLQFYRNQGTIADPYYFSQGFPLITLGILSIIYKEYQVVQFNKKMATYIGIGFICLIIGYKYQSDLVYARLFYLLCFIIYLSTILDKTRITLRSGLSYIFWGSIIVLSLILSHIPGFGPKYTQEVLTYKDVATQKTIALNSLKREYFLRSVEWFNLVNEIDPSRKTLMWYDIREPYGQLFIDFCATSHIWQGGLINQQFPLINVPKNDWTGPSHIDPEAGMEVLVLTSFRDKKMTELSSTLSEKRLKFIIIQNIKFDHSFATFDVLKIKLLRI